MAYILQHTAEAIDHKLNLIDENKNFLEYPYVASLPIGFEDAGDGSILTYQPAGATETKFLLTTCLLPAGSYTFGLEVTDIVEKTVASHDFYLEINGDRSGNIEVPTEAIVTVYLNVPNFTAGLLIKPKIMRASEENTAWVPYMKTIGTYVDERFNSTNTKLKVMAEQLKNTANIQFITWEAND